MADEHSEGRGYRGDLWSRDSRGVRRPPLLGLYRDLMSLATALAPVSILPTAVRRDCRTAPGAAKGRWDRNGIKTLKEIRPCIPLPE
jgi:hypothetical protein